MLKNVDKKGKFRAQIVTFFTIENNSPYVCLKIGKKTFTFCVLEFFAHARIRRVELDCKMDFIVRSSALNLPRHLSNYKNAHPVTKIPTTSIHVIQPELSNKPAEPKAA